MNTKDKQQNSSKADNSQLYIKELVQQLQSASDNGELEASLQSLLTPSELGEISKRLQIFKLLAEGVPQRQIAERLGVGIATVTRGSRALKGES